MVDKAVILIIQMMKFRCLAAKKKKKKFSTCLLSFNIIPLNLESERSFKKEDFFPKILEKILEIVVSN